MKHHHDHNETNGDDIIHSHASEGSGQRHVFAKGGDDVLHMMFQEIDRFSHGHHVRGDRTDEAAREGSDIFNFAGLQNVRSTVVGRIDDFDMSRDFIQIEGETLDLTQLPENVRIVEFNGMHNDEGHDPQQWLLIETEAGGHLFYALEGARIDIDGNGGSNDGEQENHFIFREPDLPDFASLRDVEFVDQVNVVPDGVEARGGVIINDVDAFFDPNGDDVRVLNATIEGGARGDLIAAGLNNDVVEAGAGADQVWGGSGHDVVNGENGDDTLYGGTGDDTLDGGRGSDEIYGQLGDDELFSGFGRDFLDGGAGDDRLGGGFGKDTLKGGDGDDKIFGRVGADHIDGGAGNDRIHGGKQADRLTGGEGADRFVFKASFGRDVITDFEVGVDHLVFDDAVAIRQKAKGVLLSNDGGSVILLGVDAADLSPDDMIFG